MDVKQFFRELPMDNLNHRKLVYEKLLDEAKGNIPSNYPMPWMIPSWEEGLMLVNEVIMEKNSHSDT